MHAVNRHNIVRVAVDPHTTLRMTKFIVNNRTEADVNLLLNRESGATVASRWLSTQIFKLLAHAS